jgi:hypothetical protein
MMTIESKSKLHCVEERMSGTSERPSKIERPSEKKTESSRVSESDSTTVYCNYIALYHLVWWSVLVDHSNKSFVSGSIVARGVVVVVLACDTVRSTMYTSPPTTCGRNAASVLNSNTCKARPALFSQRANVAYSSAVSTGVQRLYQLSNKLELVLPKEAVCRYTKKLRWPHTSSVALNIE